MWLCRPKWGNTKRKKKQKAPGKLACLRAFIGDMRL